MKKKSFITGLLAVGILLSSCSNDTKEPSDDGVYNPLIFMKSYITTYTDGPWKAWYERAADGHPNMVTLGLGTEKIVEYTAPEVSGTDSEMYRKIAERNGDIHFNREDRFLSIISRSACAHNYKSVRVVCTDGDWDADHPAGTLLNDLVEIQYYTYAYAVDEGIYDPYADLSKSGPRKRLSDLKENDLRMISFTMRLYFDSWPEKTGYNLQITFTDTEEEEEVVNCTYTF